MYDCSLVKVDCEAINHIFSEAQEQLVCLLFCSKIRVQLLHTQPVTLWFGLPTGYEETYSQSKMTGK